MMMKKEESYTYSDKQEEIKSGDFVSRIDGRKHFGSDMTVARIGNPDSFIPYGGVHRVFRRSTKEEIKWEASRLKIREHEGEL